MKILASLFAGTVVAESLGCILIGVDCLIWVGCKTSSLGVVPGIDNGLFMLGAGAVGTFAGLLIGKDKAGWKL